MPKQTLDRRCRLLQMVPDQCVTHLDKHLELRGEGHEAVEEVCEAHEEHDEEEQPRNVMDL